MEKGKTNEKENKIDSSGLEDKSKIKDESQTHLQTKECNIEMKTNKTQNLNLNLSKDDKLNVGIVQNLGINEFECKFI